jgi:hypothetical protein
MRERQPSTILLFQRRQRASNGESSSGLDHASTLTFEIVAAFEPTSPAFVQEQWSAMLFLDEVIG